MQLDCQSLGEEENNIMVSGAPNVYNEQQDHKYHTFTQQKI